MKDNEKRIGNYIKKVRVENNFNQEMFALKVLGVSRKQMGRIEHGEAKITLSDAFKIISYFNLDAHLFVTEIFKEYNSVVEDLYEMLKNPAQSENVLAYIDEVYLQQENEELSLSDYEYKTIQMIESFVLYKIYDDKKYIEKFSNSNLHFVTQNFRAMILLFPALDGNEIMSYVKTISKENQKSLRQSSHIYLSIYMNAIGHLVEKKHKNIQEMETLFDFTKAKIIDSLQYHFLPVYYRHLAIFYYNNNLEEKFHDAKEKALFFVEILDGNTIGQNILNDMKNLK